MALYSYFFGLLIACVSYYVYQKFGSTSTSIVMKPNKRYDYVIVGAGTAGCVLAARLSEDPNTSVLLIEAGEQMGYFTKIPLTATAAQLGPNDWAVKTTKQKYSSFGLWDQTQFLPRGKGLGGSGQINFLLHGFGLPEDYDRWAKMGIKGWTLDDLRPYFMKAFGTVNSEFDSGHCSLDGYCPGQKAPMNLKLADEENDLHAAFKKASFRTKHNNTIFRKATATVRNGVRFSTFDAYLKPVLMRNNLHVLLNTQGISIRFENRTASSIYILQNHRHLDNVFVNKEIVLSAGAIKTPQLLILSGIGPEKLIRRYVFRVTFPFYNVSSKDGFMFLATCVQPRSRGRVWLSDVSTRIPPQVDPGYLEQSWDVQCMVKAMRRAEQLVSTHEFKSMGATLHWPRPERCLALFRYSREEQLGGNTRKKQNLQNNQKPCAKCPKCPRDEYLNKPKSPSNEYLQCVAREVAVTGHHAAGTVALGTVLDDELRVKSLSGLRVMDASVLPSPVSLYPNSVIVGMAEKAADLIRDGNK